MEFNMEDGTFTSNEDVPYAVVLELHSDSSPENWDFDNFVLWIQSLETQTLVGIGMIAITMVTFLGAKCLSKNEEPVQEPLEVLEEPCVEEDRFRGIFSQIIAKVSHIFG